jgi:hypothetical protein
MRLRDIEYGKEFEIRFEIGARKEESDKEVE